MALLVSIPFMAGLLFFSTAVPTPTAPTPGFNPLHGGAFVFFHEGVEDGNAHEHVSIPFMAGLLFFFKDYQGDLAQGILFQSPSWRGVCFFFAGPNPWKGGVGGFFFLFLRGFFFFFLFVFCRF